MRKLSFLIIGLLLTGCSGEETGWRTKEGFQQRKEVICKYWTFFASSSTSNLERSSLIQDLQNGFKELADTTGDAKYAVLLAAADHYAQTQNLDDGIVWRIAKYCEDLAYGKE